MKALFLVLLLALGCGSWYYYNTHLVPQKEQLTLSEQTVAPQVAAAQEQVKQAQTACTEQRNKLQELEQNKHDILVEHAENNPDKLPEQLLPLQQVELSELDPKIAEQVQTLLDRYDRNSARVTELKNDLLLAEQQLAQEQDKLNAQLRQVQTRADIARIQQKEVELSKLKPKISAKESAAMQKQIQQLQAKLLKNKQTGQKQIQTKTKAYRQARTDLFLLRNRTNQEIARLTKRDIAPPQAIEATLTANDPQLKQVTDHLDADILAQEQLVLASQEQLAAAQTALDEELADSQAVLNAERDSFAQSQIIFFAVVGGVAFILLVGLLCCSPGNKAA